MHFFVTFFSPTIRVPKSDLNTPTLGSLCEDWLMGRKVRSANLKVFLVKFQTLNYLRYPIIYFKKCKFHKNLAILGCQC